MNWTGLHLGVGLGYGGAVHNSGVEIYDYTPGGLLQIGPFDLFSIGGELDFGGDGGLATVEGGYDYQINDKFVIGIMGDYTHNNIDTEISIFGDVCYEFYPDSCTTPVVDDTPDLTYTLSVGDSWSILGRAGYLVNPTTLFYGLGGYTHTTMNADLTLNSDPTGAIELLSYDYDREGLTFGAGIETMVSKNVSAKIEYRSTNWSAERIFGDSLQGIRLWDNSNVQSVRGVLSWRLGEGVTQTASTSTNPYDVDWTGMYVGVAAGIGVARHNSGVEIYDYTPGGLLQIGPFDLLSIGAGLDFGGTGAIASLETGYDFQINDKFVVGIMGDYTHSGIETTGRIFGDVCYELPGPDSCDIAVVDDTPEIAYSLTVADSWSVMGRAGYLTNPKTLIYGLAGYTHTTMEADITLSSIPTGSVELASYTYDRDGITVGAGIETKLTEKLSAKLEYRNTTWDAERVFGDSTQGIRLWDDSMVQTVRVGLTYKVF
jgi:outer membrane immunogenic protein